MDIQKKKEDRFKFLHTLYKMSGGGTGRMINGEEVGEKLGFDRNYSADIYYYLNDEGLTKPMGAGIRLTLTHKGLVEVEEALSEPDKNTEHFPPVINIINIDKMNGGAIQQGTNNSTITITDNDTISHINKYVETLNDFVTNYINNEELNKELKADIETIKQQLQSPKPKNSIIKATLLSTKDVLVGALGGIIADVAVPKAQELIQMATTLIG